MLLEAILGDRVEDKISVTLEYRLQGKARPRFNMNTGVVYMPTRYATQVQDLQWSFRECLFRKPEFRSSAALYAIEVCLIRKRRKPKNKKEAATFDALIPLGSLASGKPDWDNAAGTLSDAGNGILYDDDDQIVMGFVMRIYGAYDGAVITFFKLKGGPVVLDVPGMAALTQEVSCVPE